MNDIVPFEFEGHGVRVIRINSETWFVAKDVATALGYVNTKDAVSRHCKHAQPFENIEGSRFTPPTNGGDLQPHTIVIPIGDVFRLITRSKLEAAERFERKVYDEILPSIQQTGGYLEGANQKHLSVTAQVRQNAQAMINLADDHDRLIDHANGLDRSYREVSDENTSLRDEIFTQSRKYSDLTGKLESLSKHSYRLLNEAKENQARLSDLFSRNQSQNVMPLPIKKADDRSA